MLKRRVHVPPERLYPPEDWRIVELGYTDRYFARAETAFSLSNGYVGVRGTFDEGRPAYAPGAFVNGFHETWPIVHAEESYGLARTGQTLVKVPDATVVRLSVDDEPLFVPTSRLRDYARVLDMRAGTLERALTWSTPAGKHVVVRSCRLVSLEHRHVIAISYEVLLSDRAAPVVICSHVLNREDLPADHAPERGIPLADPRVGNELPDRVLNAVVAAHEGIACCSAIARPTAA